MNAVIAAGLLFGALAALVLPVAALTILKIKTGKGLLPAFVGAVCFIVFALILEQLLHALVLPHITSPVIYVIYGCLAAGVFEETARLLGLSLLCGTGKKDKSLPVAVGYGIGHGGAEAVILVGVGMLSSFIMYVMGNAEITLLFNINYAAQPFSVFAGGVERLCTMALHMALSILIWLVVTKRVPFYFYFVSILLHAFANSTAAWAQTQGAQFLNSHVWGIEATIAALAVIVCIIVKAIYNKSNKIRPTEKETETDANKATEV